LATATLACPGCRGGSDRAGRDDRRSNPSRAASRSRRSSPARAELAEQPTSPTATVRASIGRSRSDERQGERDGEVEAGLGDADAAGEIRVDVVAAEADAGRRAEHREEEGERGRVDARARRPACE
jgi:hypothetical protein